LDLPDSLELGVGIAIDRGELSPDTVTILKGAEQAFREWTVEAGGIRSGDDPHGFVAFRQRAFEFGDIGRRAIEQTEIRTFQLRDRLLDHVPGLIR